MDNRIRVHKKGATQLRPKIERGAIKCDASIPYPEMVGSLLLLDNGSRPGISFEVNHIANYCCDPRTSRWNA